MLKKKKSKKQNLEAKSHPCFIMEFSIFLGSNRSFLSHEFPKLLNRREKNQYQQNHVNNLNTHFT